MGNCVRIFPKAQNRWRWVQKGTIHLFWSKDIVLIHLLWWKAASDFMSAWFLVLLCNGKSYDAQKHSLIFTKNDKMHWMSQKTSQDDLRSYCHEEIKTPTNTVSSMLSSLYLLLGCLTVLLFLPLISLIVSVDKQFSLLYCTAPLTLILSLDTDYITQEKKLKIYVLISL